MKTIRGEGFTVEVPPDWERLEGPPDDFTVADPEGGVGALQISTATHITDRKATLEELRAIIAAMAETNGLGPPIESSHWEGDVLRSAVATFHHGQDFIRVWSVSDGLSVALATYVCRQGSEQVENDVAELVVRSLRFSAPGVA